MNADRATQLFFHAYPAAIRREAELLQQDGSVRHIFGGPKFIQARVRVEDEFRVRLDMIAGRWEATVAPRSEPESDIAACVAMYERLARGGRLPATPGETDEGSLPELLADALGRELEPKEVAFLDKLEKRFRRFELEGVLHDHDLVRLNPQYPMSGSEPLQLWTTPPRDIAEFWNYIAYEFEKQKVGFPRFMKAVTDTGSVRGSLEDWERARLLEQWEQLLERPASPPRGPREIPLQLRLMLSFHDLRVQWRASERHLWEPLSGPQQWTDWTEAAGRDELRLDAASALLWQALAQPLADADELRLPLDRPATLALLSRLLRQPALRERILTLDEIPLELPGPDEALRWELRPARDPAVRGEAGSEDEDRDESPAIAAATGETDADADAETASEPATVTAPRAASAPDAADPRLQLIYADGSEVPYSLRLLPGQPPLYLDDGLALVGPPPLRRDATEVEPLLEVPREVARSQRGLDWLEAIGAEISPALDLGVDEVPLRLRFCLRLARELTRASSEHATLQVEARSPDAADDGEPRRLEILERDHWRVERDLIPSDAAPRHYRRGHAARVLDTLDAFGFTWDAAESLFRTRVTRNFPERFSEWLAQLPGDIALDLDDSLGSLREAPLQAKVRFEVSQGEGDIDWFDLKIAIEVAGLDLSQERLRQLVAARGGFVRDDDGRWLRLEIDLDPEQIELVERLGLDPFDLSGEQHRMHASQLADPQVREIFDPAAWEKICARARALDLALGEEPPAALRAELRPYQLAGFRFLCYLARNQFGGVLADDMGLGKTVQSLSWLLWLKHHSESEGRPHRPSLVVAPKSVLDVWDGEAAKFAPELRVAVIRSQDEVDFDDLEKNWDLIVLNYAQLRGREAGLKGRTWRAIVLDEGQQIKNPDSRAAKAARALTAEHRLVLTGTPIENRLLDLWSIMAFAQPGVLGNRAYFRRRFDRRKDPGSAGVLANRLRPFLLRRTKSEVAIDLPARIEEDVVAEMEAAQEQLYRRELKRIQDQLLQVNSDEGLRRNNMVVLQGLMRLRQVCCHPGLVEPSLLDASCAKMDSLFYLLDQLREEGHKVLVFSQFVRMLEIIEKRLVAEERPYNLLTGQTRDRRRVIRDFQSAKDANVFLLSLKAGGTGLNLTQASYVILYDPWWNPAVENQAIDRVHRIGQENKVIAYRLLMRNSIEQKIRLLQTRKNELFKGVLGDSGFAGTLNLDDFRYLFSYDKEAEEEALHPSKRRRRGIQDVDR